MYYKPVVLELFSEGKCEITFSCQYQTHYGQNICLVGDIEELGQWKSFKAKSMYWV